MGGAYGMLDGVADDAAASFVAGAALLDLDPPDGGGPLGGPPGLLLPPVGGGPLGGPPTLVVFYLLMKT